MDNTIKKRKEFVSLEKAGFVSNFDKTLKELGLSRNAIAVESKIRPLTINELENGKAKLVNFDTLGSILKTINQIAEEKGIDKKYKVSDIFEYGSEDGQ